MSLTGPGTFLVLAGLVIAIVLLTCVLWNRMPAASVLRWPARVALVLSCQLVAVSLAGVALNDTDRFYNSWSELIGGQQGRLSTTRAADAKLAEEVSKQLSRHPRRASSALVTIHIGETGSARSHAALVYLPEAYFSPQFMNRKFPVIELLDGFPGSPQTWQGPMHIQASADAEISSGRAIPFIAVMPEQNYLPAGQDGECLDVPHGPSVESTLVFSVRTAVTANFRAASDSQSWAVMGYSTGGYCALKMALHYPDKFAAAVSVLGNTSPYQDESTGPVFTKHPGLRQFNDPMWLATRSEPGLSVLLASSHGDPTTLRQAEAFAKLARAPLQVTSTSAAPGGHNFQTFRLYEPVGFDWLSLHLHAALAPAAAVVPPAARPLSQR